MKPIVFGTDGWRGVIADDFTFERVAVVSHAAGRYFQEEGTAPQGLAIGFDNRFASAEFAALAATMLTRQGIAVSLSDCSVPSPVLSFHIVRRKLGGGLMITASHNPAKYNGVKIKPWFGGSASPEATKAIERIANDLLGDPVIDEDRAKGPNPTLLTTEDFVAGYLQHVLGFVDLDAIKGAQLGLMVDALYGSSIGVLDRALTEAGVRVHLLHGDYNPGFGGLHPEPVPDNLRELMREVVLHGVEGAVASDGDGDRISAVTETGEYVSPHHVFALLLIHLVEGRKMEGGVVKTVSTSTMINQLARAYALPLFETSIGFKYIAQLMMEDDILIGGEESGGIGIKGHIPERDATLAALLLAEMMAMRNTTLGGLMTMLRNRVGEHAYDRIDLKLTAPVTPDQREALRGLVPDAINGVSLTDMSEKDGLKLWFANGDWLLMRASGTEPVLRVYAESDTMPKVHALLQAGMNLVEQAGIKRV
jgi:phosphomannomutase